MSFSANRRFSGLAQRTELSVALENTKLMTWTTAEIEDIATRRPRLAIALLQLLVQRSMDFGSRIESFSVDNIARRLARALIRFSERLGHEAEDGSVQMIPFTHELLSQYVGTSREIVTHYMNQFRRQGYLRYSRKGILLHRDALKEWLRQEPDGRVAGDMLGSVADSCAQPARRSRSTVTLSGLPAALAAEINSQHFSSNVAWCRVQNRLPSPLREPRRAGHRSTAT